MLYQYFTTTIPGIKNMFTNLNDKPNDKPIFPQYTVSQFQPQYRRRIYFFPPLPVFQANQESTTALESINRWSHAAPGPCLGLHAALLSIYQTAQQH